MIDRPIMQFIDDERARCAALVEKLIDEPDFLLYCIKNSVDPTDDLAHFRRICADLQPVTETDEFADLM